MRAISAFRRFAALGTAVTLAVALAACGSDDKSAASGPDLGLMQAGTLRIGTLTDAPPNVYVKDGKFTGFDNDLITAVAAKLEPQAGVRRHGLLRAALAGERTRSSTSAARLDHGHRGTQEDGGLQQRL